MAWTEWRARYSTSALTKHIPNNNNNNNKINLYLRNNMHPLELDTERPYYCEKSRNMKSSEFNLIWWSFFHLFIRNYKKKSHAIIVIIPRNMYLLGSIVFLFCSECFIITTENFSFTFLAESMFVSYSLSLSSCVIHACVCVYRVLFRARFTWSKIEHQRERTMETKEKKSAGCNCFLYSHVFFTRIVWLVLIRFQLYMFLISFNFYFINSIPTHLATIYADNKLIRTQINMQSKKEKIIHFRSSFI